MGTTSTRPTETLLALGYCTELSFHTILGMMNGQMVKYIYVYFTYFKEIDLLPNCSDVLSIVAYD